MTTTVEATRRRLGRVGVWLNAVTTTAPADEQRRAAAAIERLGYGSVWTGEAPGGRDVFVKLAIWLSATDRITAGSGIANLLARPPVTTRGASDTLADGFPGRFVLGIGVGHPRQAAGVGQDYGRPLTRVRDYLGAMDDSSGGWLVPAAAPALRPPRVLAAVGPKMLALAGELTDGAHPFASPVETTAAAREILGPGKLLIPEQGLVYDPDPARARDAARAYRADVLKQMERAGGALALPYGRNLLRLGYTEEEITQVSDRVVDATIAHGDEEAIVRRIREHLDAGADHVLVNPLGTDFPGIITALERLAPALTDLS
ncbi:TIGR03620 family F420-dependent LLM class oxidoreductase [Actinomadura rubrisoli]|uniref:TIGR03620 family F420-dependent LLM class oxidoreductase n=1 Tax=Actinomadura rubrisoli TaxID=2530368 RepID=A0A4R5ALB5_9ACTN|nr:TIGR03620 family F420-dependent LLM class oxidoreductase [Actinomadura rubrisoli]TDD70902.1 TIGR03620 family F420-dependent LLM class oxidoreductase [Actinomadura rubrisoli]